MKKCHRRKRHSKKWKNHSHKIIRPSKKRRSNTSFFAKARCQETINKVRFGICDDPPPSKSPAYVDISNKSKWIAIVENNSLYAVVFTAIDNCIEYEFPKKGGRVEEIGKRCDCVLTI
jgi:hypothetical protein